MNRSRMVEKTFIIQALSANIATEDSTASVGSLVTPSRTLRSTGRSFVWSHTPLRHTRSVDVFFPRSNESSRRGATCKVRAQIRRCAQFRVRDVGTPRSSASLQRISTRLGRGCDLREHGGGRRSLPSERSSERLEKGSDQGSYMEIQDQFDADSSTYVSGGLRGQVLCTVRTSDR